MGRYIALGVGTSILLRRKKDNWGYMSEFDFLKNQDIIKNELSRLVDIDKYTWDCTEESILLRLKPEHFNNNIHDLIKELNPMINCRFILELFDEKVASDAPLYNYETKRIEINDEFNSKNYPLIIKQYEESDSRHDKGDFYCEWNNSEEFFVDYQVPEYWLFEDRKIIDSIHVSMGYITLWEDWDKYSGEDETKMLGIMNTMSRSHYKSPLSKNMFFFILG